MQLGHARHFPGFFLLQRDVADPLARQRAFDKDDLALRAVGILLMADAARVHVERFDVDGIFWHGDQ